MLSELNKRRLQACYPQLVADLCVNDVLDHLIARDIMTSQEEIEQLQLSSQTRSSRVRLLLNNIIRRSDRQFEEFLEVLDLTYPHLAQTVRDVEVDKLKSTKTAAGLSAEVLSALCTNPILLRQWRMVARELGVEEARFIDLEARYPGQPRLQCHDCFDQWARSSSEHVELFDSDVLIQRLIKALQQFRLNALANKIDSFMN